MLNPCCATPRDAPSADALGDVMLDPDPDPDPDPAVAADDGVIELEDASGEVSCALRSFILHHTLSLNRTAGSS